MTKVSSFGEIRPKLIVVNSHGPMGASLIGAMLEKLGVGNYPVREVGLTDYLAGRIALDSGHMQRLIGEKIYQIARPVRVGGVSIGHRDAQPATPKSDPGKVMARLAAYRLAQYRELADLYFDGKRIFAESLIYKQLRPFETVQIEFATDLLIGEMSSLVTAFEKNFPDVKFIHLRRGYADWIDSMALQAGSKRTLRKRWGYFSPVGLTRRYYNYNRCADRIDGLNVQFESIFESPEELAIELSQYLGLPLSKPLIGQSFDLWSTIVPYKEAFTMADASTPMLSEGSRALLGQIGKHNRLVDKFLERLVKASFAVDCQLKMLQNRRKQGTT